METSKAKKRVATTPKVSKTVEATAPVIETSEIPTATVEADAPVIETTETAPEVKAKKEKPVKEPKEPKAKKEVPVKPVVTETIKRIGNLIMDASHIANDKGRLNELGKAVNAKIKGYFKTQFNLDIVLKFSEVATAEKTPGFMIIARNLKNVKCTLFSSDFRVNPRKDGDINRMIKVTAKEGVVKLSISAMNEDLANAFREYKVEHEALVASEAPAETPVEASTEDKTSA